MDNAIFGRRWPWLARYAVALSVMGIVLAARAEAATEKVVETALKAELAPDRPLYRLSGPLRLRFALLNCSDEPVEIPLGQPLPASEGVALPLQLVLGSATQRTLTVYFEDEEGKPVSLPAPAARSADGVRMLRLAPRGVIGAEIDLRTYFPNARYTGAYRVEWRPLDGRLGSVSAQFRVDPRKDAIMVTDFGKVTFSLDYDEAPRNIENFLDLAGQGFYDNKSIHRVIAGYLIQAGCPKGDGTGIRLDGKLVPAEIRNVPVELGTLLMAHKPNDVNSASCQFFVALARRPEWDEKYTVIGQARDEESLRTLQQLATQPTDKRDRPVTSIIIRSIKLVDAEEERTRSLEFHAGRASSSTPASGTPAVATSKPSEPEKLP